MRQIRVFCLPVLLALYFANYSPQLSAKAEAIHSYDTTAVRNLFSLPDAEKILGEPGHLSDSGSTIPGIASKHSVKDSVSPIKIMAASYRCCLSIIQTIIKLVL